MKIIVKRDDGTEIDVTTAVQVTYDALHSSMDFGSGFLDREELESMVVLAQAAGFGEWQHVISSICAQEIEAKYHREHPTYESRRSSPIPKVTDEDRERVLQRLLAARWGKQ